MRKYVLVLLLLVPLRGQEPDPFFDKMVKFDKAWMAFKLEYLGCPISYLTDTSGHLTNCSGTGSMDVAKLRNAKKAAIELFGLTQQ